MTRILVLGGGVAGMLSAARLKSSGAEVTLVDTASLGGLLQSDQLASGIWVDRGTHVPRETGDIDLDSWLFGDLDNGWRAHGQLRAGNVFEGQLDELTPFPNLGRLSPSDRARMEAALLSAPGIVGHDQTAAAELDALFGTPIRMEIFEPLLVNWYGRPAAELGSGAHRFAANRVVAFTPSETEQLKLDPRLDSVLGWHDATIGASPLKSWYHSEGGCGRWIDHLRTKLDGVRILEHTSVSLELNGHRVMAATTPTERLDLDEVVSTLPPALTLRVAGVPFESRPPQLLSVRLIDLVFDRPFLTTLHYATVLDPSFEAFRVTFYPALRGEASHGPFSCTIEVLRPPHAVEDRTEPELVSLAISELVRMGAVEAGARLTESGIRLIPRGFPLPEPGGVDRRPADAVDQIENVISIGRGSGDAFFLSDVLLDAHRHLP